MRAHFAGIPTTPDSVDIIEPVPLDQRIMEFKEDKKNMEALSEFIDDVLLKAEQEASKRGADKKAKKSQQPKDKSRQSFSIPDFKNGKVVNRARGFVVKIFDAICNCANNAAAAPTQRFKLRSKRQAPPPAAATTTTTNTGTNSIDGEIGGDALSAAATATANDALPAVKEAKVAKNCLKETKQSTDQQPANDENTSNVSAAKTTMASVKASPKGSIKFHEDSKDQ